MNDIKIIVMNIPGTAHKVYKVLINKEFVESEDLICDCEKKNFSTDINKIFFIARQEKNKTHAENIFIIFVDKDAVFINNKKNETTFTETKEN